ncbi:MAG: hypothetical protein EBX40_04670, partial [Gammaproteobacteria bacterium]|nr:hypothetical protein [Gammaproteobacteria bacterium]
MAALPQEQGMDFETKRTEYHESIFGLLKALEGKKDAYSSSVKLLALAQLSGSKKEAILKALKEMHQRFQSAMVKERHALSPAFKAWMQGRNLLAIAMEGKRCEGSESAAITQLKKATEKDKELKGEDLAYTAWAYAYFLSYELMLKRRFESPHFAVYLDKMKSHVTQVCEDYRVHPTAGNLCNALWALVMQVMVAGKWKESLSSKDTDAEHSAAQDLVVSAFSQMRGLLDESASPTKALGIPAWFKEKLSLADYQAWAWVILADAMLDFNKEAAVRYFEEAVTAWEKTEKLPDFDPGKRDLIALIFKASAIRFVNHLDCYESTTDASSEEESKSEERKTPPG